ncbi:hypothetical protein BJY59DRAFT_587822 [Rhodotorula toruloides]
MSLLSERYEGESESTKLALPRYPLQRLASSTTFDAANPSCSSQCTPADPPSQRPHFVLSPSLPHQPTASLPRQRLESARRAYPELQKPSKRQATSLHRGIRQLPTALVPSHLMLRSASLRLAAACGIMLCVRDAYRWTSLCRGVEETGIVDLSGPDAAPDLHQEECRQGRPACAGSALRASVRSGPRRFAELKLVPALLRRSCTPRSATPRYRQKASPAAPAYARGEEY